MVKSEFGLRFDVNDAAIEVDTSGHRFRRSGLDREMLTLSLL